jgi:hypothetical protein
VQQRMGSVRECRAKARKAWARGQRRLRGQPRQSERREKRESSISTRPLARHASSVGSILLPLLLPSTLACSTPLQPCVRLPLRSRMLQPASHLHHLPASSPKRSEADKLNTVQLDNPSPHPSVCGHSCSQSARTEAGLCACCGSLRRASAHIIGRLSGELHRVVWSTSIMSASYGLFSWTMRSRMGQL